MPSLPFSLPQMPGQSAPPAPNPYAAGPPAAGGALDPSTQQQIMLIKVLAEQGVPFDKIPALIQSMTAGNAGGAPAPGPAQNPYPAAQQSWGAPMPMPDEGRDRGYGNVRSPPGGFRNRTRSRSPDRGWSARGSPRGRDRMDYGRNSPPRGGRHDERRGGNDYRQRSPPGRRGRSPSPSDDLPPTEKYIEHDPTLPPNHIKVLSRTLFVGGVT